MPFETGQKLESSPIFNDIDLDEYPKTLTQCHCNQPWLGLGWPKESQGITWGGCVESVDELLRHNISIPLWTI